MCSFSFALTFIRSRNLSICVLLSNHSFPFLSYHVIVNNVQHKDHESLQRVEDTEEDLEGQPQPTNRKHTKTPRDSDKKRSWERDTYMFLQLLKLILKNNDEKKFHCHFDDCPFVLRKDCISGIGKIDDISHKGAFPSTWFYPIFVCNFLWFLLKKRVDFINTSAVNI